MNGKYEDPIFYTSSSVQHSLSLPAHHVTVLIRNMLTHCLARISLSLLVPLSLSPHICLSPVSLDHCLPPSLARTPPPPCVPSPSFWRVGSSEVVAVCIAKGNVSSTRRKKWVRTLQTLGAHAPRLTHSAGLCARSESDHRVLSYPPPCVNVPTSHSCLFSSIIDGTQQLLARSTTAAAIRSRAVVWTWISEETEIGL